MLSHQLQMNSGTWEALRSQGVDEDVYLQLEFVFEARSQQRARKLEKYLRAETVYEVSSHAAKRRWVRSRKWAVVGLTQPMPVSLKILNDWVAWMVLAGARHGSCEFDGWGASVPSASV